MRPRQAVGACVFTVLLLHAASSVASDSICRSSFWPLPRCVHAHSKWYEEWGWPECCLRHWRVQRVGVSSAPNLHASCANNPPTCRLTRSSQTPQRHSFVPELRWAECGQPVLPKGRRKQSRRRRARLGGLLPASSHVVVFKLDAKPLNRKAVLGSELLHIQNHRVRSPWAAAVSPRATWQHWLQQFGLQLDRRGQFWQPQFWLLLARLASGRRMFNDWAVKG